MRLKPWRHGGKPLLIPDTHDPGNQRGYLQSGKRGKVNKSEHASRATGTVAFWPLGRWAGGSVHA